jgi:lipopolysaccharide export LptBFGC system permease protein LptF
MGYWLFFNYTVNLGYNGKLSPVVAAWGPSLMTLVVVYFYTKSRTLQSQSR